MATSLKVSQRKVALTASKPRKLTKAEHDKAFQNGLRQGELHRLSGQAAQQDAARVASKLWPTSTQDK